MGIFTTSPFLGCCPWSRVALLKCRVLKSQLGCLLNCRFLGPKSRDHDLVGLKWGPGISEFTKYLNWFWCWYQKHWFGISTTDPKANHLYCFYYWPIIFKRFYFLHFQNWGDKSDPSDSLGLGQVEHDYDGIYPKTDTNMLHKKNCQL